MAYSTVRIAAGAGVVAASLLIVGPNPAPAFADKYGWSSDDYGNNGYAKRDASNVVKDAINGISSFPDAGRDSQPDADPRKMDLGSDNEDLVTESFAPEGQMAMRSAAVAEAPAGDNLAVAVPGGGGSGYSGQPVSAFQAPRVTIGNGRTPGTHVAQPPQGPDPVLAYAVQGVPAAPAFPTAIEINIPPLPPPLPPVERIGAAELVVGQFGYGTTDTVTDPLAGVAGLFLIPAIGAVLGYRQARAAQSLRESLRT
ncbi:hypothetical protein [Mycobacterium sp. ITM-2016-00318]|uniref:hypothetical protein n=1 Tax=Mycobacterium sp. ITM-2016-00318 TaxID=2099693 RepID=UPI000CF8C552|nr:hypothetical protein [Mycobacterium sp. ITM-2016-00318]WNG94643.1 hypothetical protein C6A82_009550 [Mycobacterium sp. ITM-2016-00318]